MLVKHNRKESRGKSAMRRTGKIIAVIAALFIAVSVTFAKTPEKKEKIISQIKNEVIKTDSNLKNYKMKTVIIGLSPAPDYFAGGEKLVFYTENGKMKKIVNYNNNPDEKRIIEYYIKNEVPYFIKSERAEKMEKVPKAIESSEDIYSHRYFITPETAETLIGIQLNEEKIETEEDEKGSFDDLLHDILAMYLEIYNLR